MNGFFEEQTKKEPIYATYVETKSSQVPKYREEPIYATKYYYLIDKWLYEKTICSSGVFQKDVYWPDTSDLNSDERSSTRKEAFYVVGINNNDEKKRFEISYSSWEKLELGQKITVKYMINGKGEIVE